MGELAPLDLARTLVLVGLTVFAAAHDLKHQRIPNALILAGLLLGVGLAAASGPSPLLHHLVAAGAMLLLGLPLFATGVLGGGDVKLLIAVAAVVGPATLPAALVLTCAAGGILSLVACIRRGVLLPVLFTCRDTVVYWASLGRSGQRISAAAESRISVPYGVAISAGVLLAWFT